MLLLLIFSFLAGVATVLSPCILPVLPIMLSGVVGGKMRPYGLLFGFIVSFSVFTLFLSSLVSGFGLEPDFLRNVAVFLLIIMGILMFFPSLSKKIFSFVPNVKESSEVKKGFWGGFLTGLPLGLIWVPCAGPILAAVISVAVANGAGLQEFLIVLSYSLGTAVVMLLIILGGRKVKDRIKGVREYTDLIQKIFGILIILTGLVIATNTDRALQTWILDNTPEGWHSFLQSFEENDLIIDELNRLRGLDNPADVQEEGSFAPELRDLEAWINSEPLTLEELRGQVVLVDFWTYSCINCIRTFPYITDWYEKYNDQGFEIIGVHSPEFEFEKKFENVEKAAQDFGLKYPIALDNEFSTWKAFQNRYWPAHYLIDKEGRIQYTHFGEGEYDKTEAKIVELLEAEVDGDFQTEIPPVSNLQTPETYLGLWRLANFANRGEVSPSEKKYELVEDLKSDYWSIGGTYKFNEKSLLSAEDDNELLINVSGKNIYMVASAEAPASLKIEVLGSGEVYEDIEITDSKLYEVLDFGEFKSDQLLKLTIPKGVSLYSFTFGSK